MEEKNKLWVVTEESAVEGCHDISVGLFRKRKDALGYLARRKNLWEINNGEWEKHENEDGGCCTGFEAWEDGYYDQNHVTIYLEHCPVV